MKIAPFHAFREIIKINRILHGHLEIQNFSSLVEKYFPSERSERVKYFSTLKEKFGISAWPCNILYLFSTEALLVMGTLYESTCHHRLIFEDHTVYM